MQLFNLIGYPFDFLFGVLGIVAERFFALVKRMDKVFFGAVFVLADK